VDGMILILVGEPLVDSEWYRDIVFYLRFEKFLVTMSPKEQRKLKMKEHQYVLIVDILFRRNYDGILLRCVDEDKAQELMKEFHEGICGANFFTYCNRPKENKSWILLAINFQRLICYNTEVRIMPTVFNKNEELCDAFVAHNCRTTILSMGT
jgi:hypothetical protein